MATYPCGVCMIHVRPRHHALECDNFIDIDMIVVSFLFLSEELPPVKRRYYVTKPKIYYNIYFKKRHINTIIIIMKN